MKIVFAFNVKHEIPRDIEFDSPATIAVIAETIRGLGHTVVEIEADNHAFVKLHDLAERKQVDLVFNIAEGLGGDAREAQIPLFCEILKIP